MRIGFKIFLSLLAIAALVGVVGWRSTTTNNAVRTEVETLRRSSLQELMGAIDMMVALKETQLLTRELVPTASRDPARRGADESWAAVEAGLGAFEEHLAASRRATEAALAAAEQAGDGGAAARERHELSAWLDRIDDEIAVHRWQLGELAEVARTDPAAAGQYLEKRIQPQYVDVLQPLIQGYQESGERQVRESVAGLESTLARADRDNTVIAVLALGLALLLGLLTARSIARPIATLSDAADRIGAGDLAVRVPAGSSDEIGTLAGAFNDMAERLQTTTVSKSFVDDIIRSMGEMLIVTDPAGRIQAVNRAVIDQLGWSELELVGRDVRDLIHGAGLATGSGEAEVVTHGGASLPVVCTPRDLHDQGGRAQGRVWVARDIRDRKRVEEELRVSLAEKEALLREVHHRVKNNLQVVSSLLRLQVGDSSSPDVARLFRESESRIRSMALIHEQLYRSGDLARIDFRDYVEGLARNVLASAGEVGRPVKLTLDVEPVSLDLDVGIACGLVLNELLSNAMKHAFPDGEHGHITVTFHSTDGNATLVVSDDGVGLPASVDEPQPRSLGLRLVTALVRQLRGTSSIEAADGTRFTLTFPIDGWPRDVRLEG